MNNCDQQRNYKTLNHFSQFLTLLNIIHSHSCHGWKDWTNQHLLGAWSQDLLWPLRWKWMWHQQNLRVLCSWICILILLPVTCEEYVLGRFGVQGRLVILGDDLNPPTVLSLAQPSPTKIHEREILIFVYNEVSLHIVMVIFNSYIVFYLTKNLDEPLEIKRMPIAFLRGISVKKMLNSWHNKIKHICK